MSTTDDETLVTLNIGGSLFTTVKKTLTQKLYGNQPRHKLQNLAEGKGTVLRDSNGNIFVDRNGELFRYILDYLRNQGDLNRCAFPVDREVQLLAVVLEAEYYHLTNIVDFFRGRKQEFDNFGIMDNMALMDEGKAFCGVGSVKCVQPCVVNPGVWTSTVAAQMNLLHVSVRMLYGEQEMLNSGNSLVVGFISKKKVENLKLNGMSIALKDLIFRVETNVYTAKKTLMNTMTSTLPSSVNNLTRKENEPTELRVYYDLAKKSIYRYTAEKEWKRVHSEVELPSSDEWYFAVHCNNNKVMIQMNTGSEDALPNTN